MKIKHYAGYGTVTAVRVHDKDYRLHVRIIGNHERGIHCNEWDDYLVYSWLVKRFDKSAPCIDEWCRLRPSVRIVDGYTVDRNGLDVDTCDYYFNY